MPWLETAPVEERERFIDDDRLGLYTMTEPLRPLRRQPEDGLQMARAVRRRRTAGAPEPESCAPSLSAQD